MATAAAAAAFIHCLFQEGAVLQKAASALAVPLHLASQIQGSGELHSSGLLEKQGGSSASLWIPPACS